MAKQKTPRGLVLKIDVTPDIVQRSTTADSRKCMIAEAVKFSFPSARSVSVDLQTIRFTDPSTHLRYIYLTPRVAQHQLLNFDQGFPITPFAATLKGAHVIKAFVRKPAADGSLPFKEKTSKGKPTRSSVPREKQFRAGLQGIHSPSLVGGRAPPQMQTIRHFGLRAFVSRPEAVAAAQAASAPTGD